MDPFRKRRGRGGSSQAKFRLRIHAAIVGHSLDCLQDSPAPQFPELQHQFEQILCGHRYRLRRPQTQAPLLARPRHEFRHGSLFSLDHIHCLVRHYVASFRMAGTLPRITMHRDPTPIVIGRSGKGFNPWADCIRSRTGGVRAGDKALLCPTPCYKSVVRKNAQNTNKLRLITFAAVLFAQTPQARIVQLSPAAIPGLPANLVKELERRGCTIPQEAPTKKSSNVIKGAFAKPGQTDWAALCSVNGVSTILVFWKGSEKNPAAIAPMEDRIYIQGFKKDGFSSSRGIRTVAKDFIRRHHDTYGGPRLPRIDHQGIDDMFVGKASVVWYYYNGQWSKLAGKD